MVLQIAFRTDASLTIGTGCVMRCLPWPRKELNPRLSAASTVVIQDLGNDHSA